jgi:hypothetical protein
MMHHQHKEKNMPQPDLDLPVVPITINVGEHTPTTPSPKTYVLADEKINTPDTPDPDKVIIAEEDYVQSKARRITLRQLTAEIIAARRKIAENKALIKAIETQMELDSGEDLDTL